MKKLLIISFDLIREDECKTPYAIGSIMAYLKSSKEYNQSFSVEHLSVNMLDYKTRPSLEDVAAIINNKDINTFDYIALSAYVWNEYLTNSLLEYIRNIGFKGNFILGGYQISYSNNPFSEYPECSYFIKGYAEETLLKIITKKDTPNILDSPPDFSQLPSPYLTENIELFQNIKMIRLETKRGCPYKCTFCAHKDLSTGKVFKCQKERIFRELDLFKKYNVQKINILDPIFNMGKDYIPILEYMVKINLRSNISIQARFESIHGVPGKRFLELCQQLNITLEFGLQTALEHEGEIIERKNKPKKIENVMQQLNNYGIDYEISLIYGLPTQTLSSFMKSIQFVQSNGCKRLIAFPLMLLKGTKLFEQKERFGFIEERLGKFNIPTVIQSNSFSNIDWLQMQKIANNLFQHNRI